MKGCEEVKCQMVPGYDGLPLSNHVSGVSAVTCRHGVALLLFCLGNLVLEVTFVDQSE